MSNLVQNPESVASSSSGETISQDAEADGEQVQIVSLFDDKVFPDVEKMFDYCKKEHGFDIVALQQRLELEFYERIKLINYIRSEVKKGNKIPDIVSKDIFQDDSYFAPVLENDDLLYSMDEFFDKHSANTETAHLHQRIRELEDELGTVKGQLDNYRQVTKVYMDKHLQELQGDTEEPDASQSSSASKSNGAPNPQDSGEPKSTEDADYFTAYSWIDIHETMLKDTVRTDAYRDFIYENKDLFKGKTVIDVGCGSGILSMFCARAGATVYAIDNSNIIEKARANIKTNGLEDKITCIKGKMEEIDLPVKQVDVIVSEWMGYCLLYEAMLPSVISARDRYLKPDGLMVPSHCVLYISPFSDAEYIEDRIDFWREVYGFDMKAMIEDGIREVTQMYPTKDSVNSASHPFFTLDLYKIKSEELEFRKPFELKLEENIYNLDGFAIWFDSFFLPTRYMILLPEAKGNDWHGPGNAFTTGPHGPSTHWKTGLLLIDRSKHPKKELTKGTIVSGSVEYAAPDGKKRATNIEVTWQVKDHDSVGQQMWKLE